MFERKIKTVGSISDFVSENDEKEESKIKRFLADNHIAIESATFAIGVMTLGTALSPEMVLADTGIDAKGKEIYGKIIEIGKWFIIGKGAIDIIKSVANGDFDSAKKNGLGYVLIYVILLGLPWAFEQVELAFSEL